MLLLASCREKPFFLEENHFRTGVLFSGLIQVPSGLPSGSAANEWARACEEVGSGGGARAFALYRRGFYFFMGYISFKLV